VPNKLVVQAWRAKTWQEGIHSIVRFELRPEGSGWPNHERECLRALIRARNDVRLPGITFSIARIAFSIPHNGRGTARGGTIEDVVRAPLASPAASDEITEILATLKPAPVRFVHVSPLGRQRPTC
jgi:hypothetical protein